MMPRSKPAALPHSQLAVTIDKQVMRAAEFPR